MYKLITILQKNKEAESWAEVFSSIMPKYGIIEKLDIAHFFAQINHESIDLTALEENLNYSRERLMQLFPKMFNESNVDKYAKNPKALSLFKYKGFHGRGPVHLTWEENVRKFSMDVYKNDSIVKNPNLLVVDKSVGAHSACWFWSTKHLSAIANKDDIVGITKILNGPGCFGLDSRKERLNKYKKILGI